MSDNDRDQQPIVDFEAAKRPHAFRRKENKLKSLRQAFKAFTDENFKSTKSPGKRRRKKKKKR